ELGRTAHVKRLVRPLVVVAGDEVIELGLLLKEVFAGGLGGLELQGQMHAFVAPILLRVAGLDALDLDAEAEPPDRELGEIEQGVGTGEWDAVVGADGLGQAEMPNSRHSPAIWSPSSSRATNFSRSSMGLHSFQGILLSPQKAQLCNPCLRNELSPFSQEGHLLSAGNSVILGMLTFWRPRLLLASPKIQQNA